MQNILIAFDQKNVVQGWKVLKDRELFQELDRLEQRPATSLDLSAPVHLNMELGSEGWVDLILSAESFEFQHNYDPSRGFKTARGNLTRITSTSESLAGHAQRPQDTLHDLYAGPEPNPARIWITIHFAKRIQGVKSFTCGLEPAGFLVLRRYVSEANRQKQFRAPDKAKTTL